MHRSDFRLAVLLLVVGLAALPSTAHAASCDVPLISQQVSIAPNVMIIMDSSGSMTTVMEHDDYDPTKDYSGDFNRTKNYNVGETRDFAPSDWNSGWPSTPKAPLITAAHGRDSRYVGNYLNWIFYHASDDQRAALPQVTRQDVQNAAVRYILNNTANMRFGLTQFNGGDGGKIVADVGSLISDLETSVDDMVADGTTPLGETLYDIYEHFSDTSSSPIEYECQANFVIMLTDGRPNGDTSFPSHITDTAGNGYLDDVADYVCNRDLRSDMDGQQTMELYTIGFGINDPLLESAAQNGRGFFREAWDLETLTFELGRVLGDIVTRISAGAAVAVVSTETGDDSYLYRGKFMPGLWRGFLEAFELPFEDGDSPVWEAGELLRSRDPDTRVLFTSFNDQVVEFDTGNIDVLKYAIAPDGPGSGEVDNDGYGFEAADVNVFDANDQNLGPNFDEDYVEDVIEYVRGDHVEGFRDRGGWLLGDIVYSTPVVVGPPRSSDLSQGFQDFLAANMNRKRVVYVGANDGMIHAFDADTGKELWAYIPQEVLGTLEQFADPNYCHRSYVDLSPTAVDVEINGVWRTVLLGGLRTGGDSYFALDVTNPYAPDVLWETRIPQMVHSFTQPIVVKTNRGSLLWSGSGPNASGVASANAIHLDTGAIAWRFDLPTMSLGTLNAGSPPSPVDIDDDGIIDIVYQADLAGDLWRYDLRDPSAWWVNKMYDGSPDQPIQARPSLVFDETGTVNIMFGTGRYMVAADLTSNDQQYFNVLRDAGYAATYTASDLTTVSAEATEAIDGPGWRFPLSERSGERVTEPAIAVEGVIYFTSFAPSNEACAAGGYSYVYAVDYRTGGAIDRDGDGDLDDESRAQSAGEGIASRPVVDMASEELIVQTSDARLRASALAVAPQKILVRGWRENYDDVAVQPTEAPETP